MKYTDIDYKVYTDAARYVVAGKSPYLRHTYRYTPLLAYLLTPNILIHEIFGKILFCLIDIWIGIIIFWMTKNKNLASIHLFNPIVFNISTRGNADQVVAFFVILCVYFLHKRATIIAAIFYGISVHFKIYPLIYAGTFFFVIDSSYDDDFWSHRIRFTFVSAFTAIILTISFYFVYGYEFLYESYLYHVIRSDIRHNFSVYFYQLYLSSEFPHWLSRIAFIPQFTLQMILSYKFHKDLIFCIFVQTLAFIALNKVMTVQYFVWFFPFLSFVVEHSSLDWKSYIGMSILWVSSQSLWLHFAYQLEFVGKNTFFHLWVSGMIFLVVNLGILVLFIRNQTLISFTRVYRDEIKED